MKQFNFSGRRTQHFFIAACTLLLMSLTQSQSFGQTPFFEDFSGGSLPSGWSMTSPSNDVWLFGGSVDFGSTSTILDPSGNSGEYARIDFSNDPDTTALVTPRLSIAGVTNPQLIFQYITQTTSTAFSPYNRLIVDYWNGTSWTNITVIDTLTPAGWTEYQFNISPYTFNTDSVQFRFAAQEGGAAVGGTGTATYDQDLALDEVYIGAPITCPSVSGLAAGSLTSTSASLTWSPGGSETLWEVEVTAAGAGQGTGISDTTSSNPVLVNSGLTAQTSYDFYVRPICAAGDTGAWSGAGTFTTACASFTAPFTETFEASSTSASCWTNEYEVGTDDWTIGSGASGGSISSAFNGSSNLRFVSSSSGGITKAVSPIIDITGLTNPRLRFYYAQEFWSPDQNELKVYYRTSPASSWDSIAHYTADVSSWTEAILALPMPSTTYQIAFEGINNFGRRNVLDDVFVESTPACPAPNTLVGNSTSSTSADLSWTAGGSETLWEVEVTAAGAGQGTGISDTTSFNPVTVSTGLTANTSYDFYVRAICAPGDTSGWSNVGSFTTPCAPFVAPYTENFDGLALTSPYTALPTCWEPQTGPDFWDVTNDVTNTGHSWLPNIGDHTTGSANYMWIDASSNITGNAMITGDIDISNITNGVAGFWFASNNTTNNINHTINLDVWDGSAWVTMATESGNFTDWTEVIGFIPSSIPDTTRFRIQAIADPTGNSGTYFYNDLGVDDFFAVSGPSCVNPSNLATTTLTATNVSIGWTPGASESLWQFEIAGAGSGFANSTMDTTSQNPVSFTNLTSGFSYDFRVRAICGPTDTSFWTQPITFTVPCAGPLAGTYTLGATGNFASFTELSVILQSCGISSSVVVNVQPGVYAERFTPGVIPGASASATVTINGGDTSLVTITNGSLATIDLVGTDYMTIKNMTVENTGTTDAYGVRFSDTAEYNTIDSNRFVANTGSTGSDIVPILASNSPNSFTDGQNGFYNTISNNHIIGGYYGVRLQGQFNQRNVGYTIDNNLFQNQYFYGLYIDDQDSLTITNNIFENLGRGLTTGADGMDLNDIMMFTITGNTLINVPDLGIAFDDGNIETNATPTSRGLIANNIITSVSDNCMQLDDVVETDIWHNTLYNESSTEGAIQLDNIDSVDIRNNIFVSTGDYAFESDDAISQDTANSILDNNVYWTPPSNTKFVDDGPSIHADLTAWITALATENLNSVETNPVFANASNGDFTPLAIGADNIGAPLGILVDINGNPRSATTPDAGAIEFTGLPGDLAITGTSLKQVDACYGTSDTAFATIANVFGTSVDFSVNPLMVYWQVTGPVNTIDSLTINSGSLAVGADTTVAITTIDMSQPGIYMVGSAIGANAVNASTTNDSIMGANETVFEILSVQNDSLTITNNYSLAGLVANSPLFPTPPMFLSEIVHFRTGNGAPVGGWPSYLTAGEYVEITSVPGSDLGGTILEIWNTSGLEKSGTINPGSIVGPNGTLIIAFGEIGSSTPSPSNYYYHLSDVSGNLQSGDEIGYVLRTAQGLLIDAAGYPGNLGAYSFPAASGVTASDWTGSLAAVNSTSGMRLVGPDNNSASNWERSAVTPQDPNTLNAGVSIPVPQPLVGFDWSLGGNSVSTSPVYDAGPYANDTTLTYIASFTNTCGSFTDSTIVTVSLLNVMVNAVDISCNGEIDGTATAMASGSVSPYTYAWSNGDMSSIADSLAAGTYYVTVYDANGDSTTDSAVIAEPAILMSSVMVDNNASCNGASDGVATASSTGGTMPYSYLWSNGATTATASGLSAGTFSITITDASGCTSTNGVTITEPTALTVSTSLDSNATSCSPGGATATAAGGTMPYSYLWSNGATNSSMVDGQGSYTVTVTDANGCTSTDVVTISGPASSFVATTTEDSPVSCNGLSDGVASATASGGTAPYSFVWSTGATTTTISGLAAGSYTATVSDGGGCAIVSTVVITEPNALNAVITIDSNVTCSGFANGGATASATGGTMPYSYSWSNSASTASITGVPSGSYTVTVTDANGCTSTTSNSVSQPNPLITFVSTSSDPLCNGDATGAVSISSAGGTSPYTYAWNTGATGNSISGLLAGTYTATVTDNNGCTQTLNHTVNQPNPIVSVFNNVNDPSCNGNADGSATVVSVGGTSPFTYAWSNGVTSATNTMLSSGVSTVTITDANGCTKIDSVTLTDPALLVASVANSTNVLCFGDNSGSAAAAVTGGTQPYSYVWSNGATGLSTNLLVAGTYTMTVTDANGCTDTTTATISEPSAPLSATSISSDALCNGSADGSISATAIGGTPAYTYAWSNGSTSASISGLIAGNYTVTITDANGCMVTISDTVNEPFPITASLYFEDVQCNGDSTGLITPAGLNGGTAPYTFNWSTGETSDTISGLPAGTYTVTITDVNSCTGTASVTIEESDAIIVQLAVDNAICENGNDGAISSTVTGGVGNYAYVWSNAETTSDISGLIEGTYEVTVSDDFGCTQIANETVGFDNPNPVVDLGPDAAVGPGTITLSSGYPNASNLWSTNETTESISPTISTDTLFWVVVTTDQGCVGSDTILVEVLLSNGDIANNSLIKLYPNPTNGLVNIQVENLNANEVAIQVLDFSGKLVLNRSWISPSTLFNQQVDLSNQSQGVYFINVVIDGHKHTERITIY